MQNPQASKNLSQPSNYRLLPAPEKDSSEWYLCNYFETWTPDILQSAIKKDWEFNFYGLINQVVEHVIDQFLNWAKTYRPDLYEVAKTYEGKKWLRMNILKAMKTLK